MTIKELIKQLRQYNEMLDVYYVNEETGYEDEVVEIIKKEYHNRANIVILAREGCFG